jgi:ferredoxin
MTFEVSIDEGACMGSHECSYWAPGVFDNREDGTAFVVDLGAAPEERIIEAARRCPNFAIRVTKDDQRVV